MIKVYYSGVDGLHHWHEYEVLSPYSKHSVVVNRRKLAYTNLMHFLQDITSTIQNYLSTTVKRLFKQSHEPTLYGMAAGCNDRKVPVKH